MNRPEFTIHHQLLNTVERTPEKEAMVDGAARYSYEALFQRASNLAGALKELGLRRGDRVGIYLEKSWDAVVSLFAVVQAGGVFVNIGPQLRERQVRHIMQNCGVRVFITEPGKVEGCSLPSVDLALLQGERVEQLPWAARVESLAAALTSGCPAPAIPAIESDLATIIYTSGSTGLPKGIMFSHHNLVVGAQIVSTYLENTASDRVLAVLPINQDYGLNQITTMVRVGGTAVLQRSLLPADILRSLRAENITGMAGMPPVWTLVLQMRRSLEQEPLTHLRYLTNSGGTIPGPHLEQLRFLFPSTRIFLMYGLTEAFRATYLPPEEIHRGPTCIGRSIPNSEVNVVDADGREVGPGEVGELIQRGPTVAMGYWGDKEKTDKVYRPNPLACPELREVERVVYSGDLVRRGEDGFLYYVGRRDEQIKTQGYRVSPGEVEELLTGAPGVKEAVAFGAPDPVLGQRIVAVVSVHEGTPCTAELIRSHIAACAPPYMVPRNIHLLPDLPRTATGKIDRSALKNEYRDRQD